MQPTLVAIAGPLTGAVFPLSGAEIVIGRDPGNTIVLPDPSVEPRHCVLGKQGARLFVRLLGGAGQTFVNGLPAGDRPLGEGDEIRIGQSLFVLHVQPTPVDGPGVEIVSTQEEVEIQRELRREEVLSLQHQFDARVSTTEFQSADVVAFLRLSTAINSIRGYVALQRPFLELLCDIIPACRGAVLLLDDDRSVRHATGLDREADPRAVCVPRKVLDHVLKDGSAVLARTTGDGNGAPSRQRQLLAAPIVTFDRVLGAVYLESTGPANAISERHLVLLAAICGMAGVALDNARHLERLEEESRRSRAEIDLQHNMVGSSPIMRHLYQHIVRVAHTDATVLIIGESGTGKELAARAIHRNSTRAEKPFVAINCAAIPEALLESELFGHEKGAFTGAIAQKRGRFELTEGGTLLLDEIGELPLALQAKLLRVLQEREFERVGGTRPVKVDFRLIASTNRNLESAVKAGAFRQDLYYRLNVVPIRIPPLRERREDIPLLAQYFARRHPKTAARATEFLPEALAMLMAHDWPGNVRELENAVERAIVLGEGGAIRADDLPEFILDAPHSNRAGSARYHEGIRERKKELILEAIEQAGGNLTAAARQLGVHPNYLHRLLRTLHLRPELEK
jgi:transcriptional regulator with GAF, ATPase, and Fis domain